MAPDSGYDRTAMDDTKIPEYQIMEIGFAMFAMTYDECAQSLLKNVQLPYFTI